LKKFFSLLPIANQFPPLHGLRVLAIVSVLQVHVTVVFVQQKLLTDPNFAEVSTTICFGMDLFFVMSGFLIGFMLLRALEQRRPGLFARFYARRAARIMPLYYFILTALAVVFPLTQNQKHALVFEYLYLTNYYHFKDVQVMGWAWSLCVEEHFYFTVPLLLLLLARLRSHAARIGLLAVLALTCLGIRLSMLYLDPSIRDPFEIFRRMYLPTHTRFDTLIAGIFLAYLQYNFTPDLREIFARRGPRIAAYAVAAIGFWILMSKRIFGGDTYLWNVLTWGTVTSITYIALLLPLINSDGLAQRLLGSKPMYWLATLSYGIYLLHVPICEGLVVPIAHRMHAPFAVVWPASLAMLVAFSTIFAYVLHLLVEKPFLLLRERIAR